MWDDDRKDYGRCQSLGLIGSALKSLTEEGWMWIFELPIRDRTDQRTPRDRGRASVEHHSGIAQ
jgi:hypothetical protein